MKLRSFGQTDRGRTRERNEDAFVVDEKQRFYAVADGLGGLPEGAEASRLAIDCLCENLELQDKGDVPDLEAVIMAVNGRVTERGKELSKEIGIATTLTILFPTATEWIVAHVGDCAAFLVREKEWRQLTTDHTMEAELRARLGPDEETFIPEYLSHTLTRCIGQDRNPNPDIIREPRRKGDRMLLCSDGATKVIDSALIAEISRSAKSPQDCVGKIIDLANSEGGPDNITVVAVFS